MEHEETKESLARLEHEQWSHWMIYMFNLCSEDSDGNYIIPSKKVERWKRQMETKYKDLTEKEKDSDRTWADKTLKRIKLVSLLKDARALSYEMGANYVLSILLEQKKITHEQYIKSITSLNK